MRAFNPSRTALCLLVCLSQAWCLRPGIPRVTWTSDHFTLTIDERKQETLPYLAALAEECFVKQAAFFEYSPPSRIQVVFLDEQDYANGAAYSAQGWVVIYLFGADHALRGRTRWLPGVLSHEIGHILSLRKMGDDSRFLGLDLFHSWSGAGGSSFDEGVHIRDGETPPWLAEGLAQYAAGICGYDTLDSHRNMVLRTAAAEGALLSLAEMKAFAWDGRRNEMIYTQGYALVSHLYGTYGPKAVNAFLAQTNQSGWRSAFRSAFGRSIEKIYWIWRKDLEKRSQPARGSRDGEPILSSSGGKYAVESFPSPLADGRFLFLSSRQNDYGETDLYIGDDRGGSVKLFSGASSVVPDRDGRGALFTSTRHRLSQGEPVSDLYAWSAEGGRIRRLSTGARLIRGSRAGGTVYALRNSMGRTSIVVVDKGEWTTFYTPPDSLEIADLAPGRTDSTLTLTTVSGFGGDIRELDLATRELTALAESPQDERDPHWNGDSLIFSADYSGSFDIYALADMQVTRLSQVSGGAFHPAVKGGDIWYSGYGPGGFLLAKLKRGTLPSAPFVAGLPIPAWKPPAPAEHEPGSLDRTSLGLLGYGVSAGVIRSPGYASPGTQAPGDSAPSSPYSFDDGTRVLGAIDVLWANPTGVVEAWARVGYTRPLDYVGNMHFDDSHLEIRVNAFLPTIVAGADWNTFDLADYTSDGRAIRVYQAALRGHAGLELRLAEHWYAHALMLVENDFVFLGEDGDKVFDSNPQPGATTGLLFSHVNPGVDGIVSGWALSLDGTRPPPVSDDDPDFAVDAGARVFGSLGRLLFLQGSLYHSGETDDAYRGWMYGGASAHAAIPLRWQIGTRGGAGLFLDKLYPGVEYLELARIPGREGASGSLGNSLAAGRYQGGRTAAGSGSGFGATQALRPRIPGFDQMLDRKTSHEIEFSLALKTLSIFPRAEKWVFGVRYDAADFGRDPVWSVMLSL